MQQSIFYLGRMESHYSLDKQQASIIFRVLAFSYTTLTLLPIIAYGYIPNLPNIVQNLKIFQGIRSYKGVDINRLSDFSYDWYSIVGSFLLTLLFFQVVIVSIITIFPYKIIQPLLKFFIFPLIQGQKSHLFPFQYDVNQLIIGPEFQPGLQAAQILIIIFMSMTFASGIPLFMPLGCIACFVYFGINKWLICKYYMKPAYLGRSRGLNKMSLSTILKCLPYAAVIRLSVACWMFSAQDSFMSTANTIRYKYLNTNFITTKSNNSSVYNGDNNANSTSTSNVIKSSSYFPHTDSFIKFNLKFTINGIMINWNTYRIYLGYLQSLVSPPNNVILQFYSFIVERLFLPYIFPILVVILLILLFKLLIKVRRSIINTFIDIYIIIILFLILIKYYSLSYTF